MGGFVRLEQEEQEPAPRLSRGSREAQPDRRARKYAFSSSFSLHGRTEEIRGRRLFFGGGRGSGRERGGRRKKRRKVKREEEEPERRGEAEKRR